MMTAKEFRNIWLEMNPNTIHIPSEHEVGLMEAYAGYFHEQNRIKQQMTILELENKVRVLSSNTLLAASLPIDMNKVIRLDEPYSLPEILKGLTECADILLHKKDYDGDGWERLEYCYRHGKDVIKLFE